MSNDNPFSEAQFKTLKYCAAFPDRFGSLADARGFCGTFFDYCNHDHRHSGIGLHTPASVHFGTAAEIRAQRATTLDAAYAAHPVGSANARSRRDSPTPPGSTNQRRHDDIVATMVPAIVIAIFVFAVGSAFVVARIVPPTRGARALVMLRQRLVMWCISLAPTLVLGSAVLVSA